MERALFHRPLCSTPSSPLGVPVRALPLHKHRIRCCYMESINDKIMTHLEKAMQMRPPLVVFEPMRRMTFSAPPSAAPALCVAACELVGGDRDRAIPTAAALHIMHAASYFHEHLPLSEGTLSRLKPEIDHEFSPNIELLTGDGMVPLGFEMLARSDNPVIDNPELTLRVIIEITRAIGSQGIIHGQYLRAKCTRPGYEECDADWSDSVLEKRWDELHGCAAACGAILGFGSETEVVKLRRYGVYVGLLRGMLNDSQRHDLKSIDDVKKKAVRELEEMDGAKVGPIMTLLDYDISNAAVTFS